MDYMKDNKDVKTYKGKTSKGVKGNKDVKTYKGKTSKGVTSQKRKGIADQISEIVRAEIKRKLKEQSMKGSKAGILKSKSSS